MLMSSAANILKTYKLYINGQFPRSESGRYYVARNSKGEALANICLASRKDFRDAVVAARAAQRGWAGRPAFNRGQILYRIAEMLEGRKAQFREELIGQGASPAEADQELRLSIDRLVYYAGWCDKYTSVFGTVNPVASSHFNFSIPEPMGVVAIVAPENYSLLGVVSTLAPVIAGGNTCILFGSEQQPLCTVTFGEVLASSDVPAGVVNLLTGNPAALIPDMASHMDVNALIYCGRDARVIEDIRFKASSNIKRTRFYGHTDWRGESGASPYFILDVQETKTTWHPVESATSGGGKY